MPQRSSHSLAVCIANVVLAPILCPVSAWGWGKDGHKIVAIIAADNLTPAAKSHVANILGVAPDQVAAAMETASNRPDTEFREEDSSTGPWHFINVCLQDQRSDVPARCLGGNCVTRKIDEYATRLKDGDYDRWGASGDLAFLIHLVGDIHQPLHAANDADRGANCVMVDSQPPARDLHAVWDTTVVRRLEDNIDSGRPEATARRLEQTYAAESKTDSWIPADDIAWESIQVARTEIYTALQIPIEPCQPTADTCTNPAGRTVELTSAYLDHADEIAGHQLAKAGFRLASLLNETWMQPVADDGNGTTRALPSAAAANLSSTALEGPIVGNRRSGIYAWPGCGTYDAMAPHNRVVFASRYAAELAGYHAAGNCP